MARKFKIKSLFDSNILQIAGKFKINLFNIFWIPMPFPLDCTTKPVQDSAQNDAPISANKVVDTLHQKIAGSTTDKERKRCNGG